MAATAASSMQQGTKVRDHVTRVANVRTPFLAIIPSVPPENSAGPLWNLEKGTGTVVTHAEGAAYPAESDVGQYQASLGWSRRHTKILLTDEAKARARFGNPGDMRNIRGRKIGQRVEDMLKGIQFDVFQGAGTANNIAGLNIALSDSGTYAGVARASEATFGGTVMSSNPTTPGTGFALTKARLRTFISTITERGSVNQEDLILVCPESVWNAIVLLYEEKVTFAGPQAYGQLGGVRPRVTFDGLQFIVVPAADAAHSSDSGTKKSLWAVHINRTQPERGLHWEGLPYVDDRGEPGGKVWADGLPWNIQIVNTPESSHSDGKVVRNMGQIVYPEPATGGILNDILI